MSRITPGVGNGSRGRTVGKEGVTEIVKKSSVSPSLDGKKGVEREGKRRDHLFKPGNQMGGRPKGLPNKITRGIKDAVMESIQPGQCHPEGLAGWLRERALGGIEDRKIYAGIVSRVIPIEVTGADGGPVKIDLGWLTGRSVGRQEVDVTPTSQDYIEHNEINGLGTDVPDYQSDEVENGDH